MVFVSGMKEALLSFVTRPKWVGVSEIVVCFRREGGFRLWGTRPNGLVFLKLSFVSGRKEELLSGDHTQSGLAFLKVVFISGRKEELLS